MRDEDPMRATSDPTKFGNIISAVDAVSGGTWMGVNVETGAFVALTNVRQKGGAQPPAAASRGQLVRSLLSQPYGGTDMFATDAAINPPPFPQFNVGSSADIETAYTSFYSMENQYAGFNMLCGRLIAGVKPVLQLASNRSWNPEQCEDPSIIGVTSAPTNQTFCFSNGRLGSRWHKVDWFKDKVSKCVASAQPLAYFETEQHAACALFESVRDAIFEETCFTDEELARAGDNADIHISEFSPSQELALRRHVFLRSTCTGRGGTEADEVTGAPAAAVETSDGEGGLTLVTRSLTMLVVAGGALHYLYQDTTAFPHLGTLFARTELLPSPTSAAATEAADIADATAVATCDL